MKENTPRNIYALMPFVSKYLNKASAILGATPEREKMFDQAGRLDPFTELDLCVVALELFFTTQKPCEKLIEGRSVPSLFRKPLLEIRKRFQNNNFAANTSVLPDAPQLEIVPALSPIPPTGFSFTTFLAKMLAAKVLNDAGETEAAAKVWN